MIFVKRSAIPTSTIMIVHSGGNMGKINMTDSELELMEALWAKEEPVFLGELLEYFNARTQKDWKKQTVNTFLFKMQQKHFVEAVGGGRYKKYRPLITKEEYLMEASRRFLDRNHGGSIVRMITALNGGEKLEKQEVEELKKMLSEWERE